MKKKSELYPKVTYERWKTPLTGIPYYKVALSGVLQTLSEAHFFFEVRKSKRIRVMSILKAYPYRILEEGLAYSCNGKYFRPKDPKKAYKKKLGRPEIDSPGWKLWGTDFVNEVDEFDCLSGYGGPKRNICNYLVSTGDDEIEVLDCEPIWEIHQNITVEKLMIHFIKTRFEDSSRWGKKKIGLVVINH